MNFNSDGIQKKKACRVKLRGRDSTQNIKYISKKTSL